MELIPDLSICLFSHSGWACLRSVLGAFYEHSDHVSLEFFVVEDDCEDGLESKLGQHFPEVHLFEKQHNVNKFAALNSVIRLATGRYIALWDDDLLCQAGCLTSLLSFMDDTPDAGIVGPKLSELSGKAEPSCFQFPHAINIISGFLFGRDWRKIRNMHVNTPQEVDWLSSSALIFRREALDDVGFLDEGYGECYTDLDWCYRAGKVGWHTHYVPSAYAERLDCSEENGYQSPVLQLDWWCQARGLLRFFRKKWTSTRYNPVLKH